MHKRHRTLVFKVDPMQPDPAVIDRVASVLLSGGLAAFPTETVYGLAAVADNPEAIALVFAAKERPRDQPLSVQVASETGDRGRGTGGTRPSPVSRPQSSSDALPLELELAISTVVREIPDPARRLIRQFMPGPLTLVLPAPDEGTNSLPLPYSLITAGTGKIGVRVPTDSVATSILRAVGKPLVVTSANRHGWPATISAAEILEQLDGRIDLLLDGGPCTLGKESTVVDVTVEPPVILRVGAISAAEIERAIGQEQSD
jgi:L-threonylcarbamoyladenylate synthase